jgi:hypothetical protein
MKTEILNKEVNEEIDWSKPQWVISEKGSIIFTNGEHGSITFEGSVMPCKSYSNGGFRTDFMKNSFQPIPKDGLTIHIQND